MTTSLLHLQERVAALVDEHGVPGASVSVLADGEITDAVAGVVDLGTGHEVRVDSPFMIQSITKVWTATLVMQLVDEGQVDLDAPVRRYLPEFRTADSEASSQVTVEHLLTHTGGFEGDLWAPTTSGDDALERFVLDLVSQAGQHAPPGRFHSYCSAGFGVLGRIVEVVRGTTYDRALRRYLTDPLGIDGVVVDAGEAALHRTAIGHVSAGPGGSLRPLPTWAVLPPSNPAAGNQLAMPARGLTAFAAMHLAEGRTADGGRVLSAESARRMRTPQVDVLPTTERRESQGLGWRMTTAPHVVEHGGGAPGCGALLQVLPDHGVAVAVVANGGDLSALAAALSEQLLGDLAGVESPVSPPVPPAAAIDAPDRYCGRYELRTQVSEVTVDGSGHLWLTREPRNEALAIADLAGEPVESVTRELRRADGETFRCVDSQGHDAGTVEFLDSDADGRPRYLHCGRAAPRVG